MAQSAQAARVVCRLSLRERTTGVTTSQTGVRRAKGTIPICSP